MAAGDLQSSNRWTALSKDLFASIRWAPEALEAYQSTGKADGEADLAIQFAARTELAVCRAVVEVWKAIRKGPGLPLEIVTFMLGSIVTIGEAGSASMTALVI
jgi:hypothetical protein